MAARYRDAIAWIAENDEPLEGDPNVIEGLISVGLVADLWQKAPAMVANDILRYRQRAALRAGR